MTTSPDNMALAVSEASRWLRTVPGALKIAGVNQAELERVTSGLDDAATFFLWFGPNAAFVRACVKNRERVEAALGRAD